jgi:hypothetical protein
MAYTITTDISRMLLAGQKEIFTRNFNAYPIEYPWFTTPKKAVKQTETYDSMGNLKAAGRKVEGDAITYGKITQAYQTSITNYTWANGFEVTIEATKYDLYGVVNSAKAKELARTMRALEEENAVYWVDNAAAVNLADGVPLASDSKPLTDSSATNDTLATSSSIAVPDNHKTVINMFYAFKNHAGGPMIARPNKALTHYVNQMTVEEVYRSMNKANEFSNTKNILPKISWGYSTYMTSQTAWMMWDSSYEHILMQWFMKTAFDADTDKIYTKNMYFNAIAMYNSGCLPNIGIVYNAGA